LASLGTEVREIPFSVYSKVGFGGTVAQEGINKQARRVNALYNLVPDGLFVWGVPAAGPAPHIGSRELFIEEFDLIGCSRPRRCKLFFEKRLVFLQLLDQPRAEQF
jgi:hypothetical protein